MLAWFLLGIVAGDVRHARTPRCCPYNMANVAHGVGLASGMVLGLLRL